MQRAQVVVSVAALLVVLLPTASAQQVYKWKDASGATHFSDTPPPSPANAPQAAGAPRARPAPTCRPDISAAECQAAAKAMRRDAADLASPPGPANWQQPAATTGEDPRVAAVYARECAEQQATIVALRQRAAGESTEIMTPDEQAALPAQITAGERYIAANCKR